MPRRLTVTLPEAESAAFVHADQSRDPSAALDSAEHGAAPGDPAGSDVPRRATYRDGMRVVPRVPAALAAMLLAGCAAGGTTAPSSPTSAPPTITAAPSTASASPLPHQASWSAPCIDGPVPARYDHVVWIVMENKQVGDVAGTQAPETARLAHACAWGADHLAVTHPSLPNYLALTSGSTHDVHDDAPPADHPLDGPSVFSQAADAGIGWATYAESMPTPCALEPSGRYAVKHNPAAYFTGLGSSCAAHDLPLGTPDSGALASALQTGSLPGFSLVVPDLCSDTHDCPVSDGDAWLGRWLQAIVESPVYAQGRTAVMVTWDEDDDHGPNRVGLLLVAPSVRPGTVITARTTHEGMLRTTEEMLGLPVSLAPDATSFRNAARL